MNLQCIAVFPVYLLNRKFPPTFYINNKYNFNRPLPLMFIVTIAFFFPLIMIKVRLNKLPFCGSIKLSQQRIQCVLPWKKISIKEDFVIIKKSNLGSSRRQFLKNALPAGALLCFGCKNLFALPGAGDVHQADTEKHPFLQETGMTAQEVFQFAYQMNMIPHMKKFQKYIGYFILVS